jgi:hypothetical protein
MKKLFPNIETAIIFVFVICMMLWGISRCNKKKVDMAAQNAIESPVLNLPTDTSTTSPAARKIPNAEALPPIVPNVPAPTPTDPNQGLVAPPQSSSVPMPSSQLPSQPVKSVPMPGSAASKPVPATPSTTPTMANGTILYVLINGLNVRTKPELKAKSLGKLKLNDQVYFMNEVTEAAQIVRLQDKTEISKPWFKIKTKRGTVGWVHGSGVDFYKRKPQEGL